MSEQPGPSKRKRRSFTLRETLDDFSKKIPKQMEDKFTITKISEMDITLKNSLINMQGRVIKFPQLYQGKQQRCLSVILQDFTGTIRFVMFGPDIDRFKHLLQCISVVLLQSVKLCECKPEYKNVYGDFEIQVNEDTQISLISDDMAPEVIFADDGIPVLKAGSLNRLYDLKAICVGADHPDLGPTYRRFDLMDLYGNAIQLVLWNNSGKDYDVKEFFPVFISQGKKQLFNGNYVITTGKDTAIWMNADNEEALKLLKEYNDSLEDASE